MCLEIRSLWSPDVDPPDEGLPDEPTGCEVFVKAAIGEVGEIGHEVVSVLVRVETARIELPPRSTRNRYVTLERFDWSELRTRIESVLRRAEVCRSWDEVVATLSPYVHFDDEPDP